VRGASEPFQFSDDDFEILDQPVSLFTPEVVQASETDNEVIQPEETVNTDDVIDSKEDVTVEIQHSQKNVIS